MARIRTKTFTHPDLPGDVYTFAAEAEDFSAVQNYSAGQYCIYNGDLYRFTADHSAGAWSGSDATQVLLADDLAEMEKDLEDLKSSIGDVTDYALNAYATDTASGAIATFPDGADGIPIKQLSVAIEPVQDLHGYENPWPAGGGKNLLPMTVEGIKEVNTSGTWVGNSYTYGGVTFEIQTDDANNVIGIKQTILPQLRSCFGLEKLIMFPIHSFI